MSQKLQRVVGDVGGGLVSDGSPNHTVSKWDRKAGWNLDEPKGDIAWISGG